MLQAGNDSAVKICSAPAPVYGSVDFNKNRAETRGLALPAAGIPVSYNRCPRCGFLFTAAFNEWGRADYQQAIYNDDYIVVDPDYRETRPTANAAMLAKTFNPINMSCRCSITAAVRRAGRQTCRGGLPITRDLRPVYSGVRHPSG